MNRNIYISTYEGNTLLFKIQTTCLFEEEFLTYHTDNDNIKVNLKNFSFTKENVESILKITSDKCILTLKDLKQSLDIPLDYVNYTNDNNKNIAIEYKLISQELPLKIVLTIGSVINEI